jgi:hypothetical protein
MVLLWTWQGCDFDPLSDRLDRSKSNFWTMDIPGCPDIRKAYVDIDELLCLPKDREHQFAFCLTIYKTWVDSKRRLWRLDVPPDIILAYLDNPTWRYLIGDTQLPDRLREPLILGLRSRNIGPETEQWRQEFSTKEHEYYDSFGPREVCKKKLLIPPGSGEEVVALVPLPFNESWIRSS